MRVTIDSISGQPPELIVGFKSPAGSGMAKWRRPPIAPRIGAIYDVELDVVEPVELAPVRPKAGIELAEGQVLLTGVIDSIDDDGMACLRIAPDCLTLFEKGTLDITAGGTITLRLEVVKLELTPI